MKPFVCLVCALSFVVSLFAQTPLLQIITDKTTSLIFPFAIKHVDRGTKDILVEPVKEAGNILLVKAATKDFEETNLSVITEDGSVYSFLVCYGEPSVWVHHLPAQRKASMAIYANSVLDNPKTINGIKDASWGMVARVIGIYIKDNIVYYQLDLQNQSPLDYDISFLCFYIRDKKKAIRTAIQENELRAQYVAGNTSQVKSNSHNSVVVALEKFTIPDQKYLVVEIGEKNGGRNLTLKIDNRKIMKAILLSDLK